MWLDFICKIFILLVIVGIIAFTSGCSALQKCENVFISASEGGCKVKTVEQYQSCAFKMACYKDDFHN